MMKKARGRPLLFLSAAILAAASFVAAGVFSGTKQETKRKRAVTLKAERVSTLPEVISRVKDLQVAGATLLNQGRRDAAVAVDIINNSDQPVISLELVSGDDNDWSALGMDGLEDPDSPLVTIPPHSLKTFTWFLGEVLEGYPIVISGAVFGDGTEDGDTRTLDTMHKDRERNRAQKARKGGQQ